MLHAPRIRHSHDGWEPIIIISYSQTHNYWYYFSPNQIQTFPLSDEGMDEAIAWLFERFETEKSKWLNANRDAMHIVNNQTF